MKKTVKLLALLTALCAVLTCLGAAPAVATATSAPENLIKNGSFESVIEGGDDPVDWEIPENSANLFCRKNLESYPAKNGEYHFRTTMPSRSIQQSVQVTGGHEYLVSFWIRTNLTNKLTDGYSPVVLTLSTSDGTTDSSGTVLYRGQSSSYNLDHTDMEWKKVEIVYTPCVGATSLLFKIRTGAGGGFVSGDTFDMDDVSIREVADGDNHISNGDFDAAFVKNPYENNDNAHEKYQNWVVSSSKYAVPASFGVVTSEEDSTADSNYMKMVAGETKSTSGSYLGYGNITYTTGVEKGTLYKFSCKVKGTAVTGVQLSTSSEKSSSIFKANYTVDATTTWETVETYFIAESTMIDGVESTPHAFGLQLYTMSAGAEACIDDVSLVPVEKSVVYFSDASERVLEDREKVTRTVAFYVPEVEGQSSVTIMTAIYKVTDAGTTLNDVVAVKNLTSTAGEAVFDVLNITIPADTATESYYARAFLWNSTNGLVPVTEAIQMQ